MLLGHPAFVRVLLLVFSNGKFVLSSVERKVGKLTDILVRGNGLTV